MNGRKIMNNNRSNKNSNSNGANSSQSNQSKEPREPGAEQPAEESRPTPPPLGAPQEPSHASLSDSSKYTSLPKNGEAGPKPGPNANYTTESTDRAKISEEPRLGSHQFQQEDYQGKYEREEKEETSRKGREREWQKEGFTESSRYSKEQVITYAALIIGLIILFFNGILGGFIVGLVVGYHFADEIMYYLRHLGALLRGANHLRMITLSGLGLAILIAIPSLVIGAVLVAVFKQVLGGKGQYSKDNRPPYS